mmetsp:Transcript_10497/g.30043  ORF Transcript_10497/g.30043 Transcript_10497/m.30043 type:complete len:244 (-) Transcript_10497:667-1398(-)
MGRVAKRWRSRRRVSRRRLILLNRLGVLLQPGPRGLGRQEPSLEELSQRKQKVYISARILEVLVSEWPHAPVTTLVPGFELCHALGLGRPVGHQQRGEGHVLVSKSPGSLVGVKEVHHDDTKVAEQRRNVATGDRVRHLGDGGIPEQRSEGPTQFVPQGKDINNEVSWCEGLSGHRRGSCTRWRLWPGSVGAELQKTGHSMEGPQRVRFDVKGESLAPTEVLHHVLQVSRGVHELWRRHGAAE